MVVASPANPTNSAAAAIRTRNPKKPTVRQEDLPNPRRSPLLPSEKDNAGCHRRPRTKEVTSRYLSSYSSSFSSTTSTSPSSGGPAAVTAISSSSSPSTALPSRRFPSPLLPSRSSPTSSTMLHTSTAKRSQSVDRSRAAATRLDTGRSNNGIPTEISATRPLCTTRRLSVSFQGESFVFQTSKVQNDASCNSRKPTPDRRASSAAPMRNGAVPGNARQADHSKSGGYNRWPSAQTGDSPNKGGHVLANTNFKQHSLAFDETGDLSASSDTDSASSGSNSGAHVPGRFWQDTNSKRISPKLDRPFISPRTTPSSTNVKGMLSPARMRSSAPSMINFAAEVLRRGKRGESRVEEAHSLRLLHNRHLQWRYANARASSSLSLQTAAAEKSLHSAWIASAQLRDSVVMKKITLHLLRRNMKLGSLLREQMIYLEEWSLMDQEHGNSLSGAIEALKSSILRIPIVSGARANIQEIKEAAASAVELMQSMWASLCSLFSKVDQTSSLAAELLRVAAQERALLEESQSLHCSLAAMHVKQCSLWAHLQQLSRHPG